MRRLLGPWALAAALATIFAVHPLELSAQSPSPATIPSDQAQEFMGRWSLGITGGQGEEITLSIDIQDQDGRVAAQVTAEGLSGSEPVSRISRSGDSLVLSLMPVVQGQPIPVRIDLTPAGEDLNAEVSAADGMFMASGTATRE